MGRSKLKRLAPRRVSDDVIAVTEKSTGHAQNRNCNVQQTNATCCAGKEAKDMAGCWGQKDAAGKSAMNCCAGKKGTMCAAKDGKTCCGNTGAKDGKDCCTGRTNHCAAHANGK